MKTPHQIRVEEFLRGIGRDVPERPTAAAVELQVVWARLLLEETLEAILASGVRLSVKDAASALGFRELVYKDVGFHGVDGQPVQLAELAKELADVSVVATGYLSINGISDEPVLAAVDENNLLKVRTGRRNPDTGKFEKHPNHPKPDVQAVLNQQRGQVDGN